ncbi:cell division protein ZapA [Roseibium suaedae]|uniref:Cell division protein ZapA n=1 Tax=Roseibium suaedae TaxID=735517 RepID=A0A1M7IQ19_9HYPH|nr:cell division protein ZapA [Roseibium suaedae]SHM42912.1 cell division protein ZapA [Roseibium suaedae]
MAQINVIINGRSFRMACDDGEEDRLIGLAKRFDGWIDDLRGAFGEIGDQRLTVMAGIMATDQLVELEKKIAALEADLSQAKEAQATAVKTLNTHESDVAGAIDKAAAKIESLAEGLTRSLRLE